MPQVTALSEELAVISVRGQRRLVIRVPTRDTARWARLLTPPHDSGLQCQYDSTCRFSAEGLKRHCIWLGFPFAGLPGRPVPNRFWILSSSSQLSRSSRFSPAGKVPAETFPAEGNENPTVPTCQIPKNGAGIPEIKSSSRAEP